VTGAGPLFPRKTTRGHADCLPRAARPRCTPRGGAVLRQTFGVRVSWTCCCSASGPARHRAECTAPWLLSQGDRGRAPLSRELSSLGMPRCGSGEGGSGCTIPLLRSFLAQTCGRCTAPHLSSQGDRGRAPSISIGSGRSALERSLETVSSARVAAGTAPTGAPLVPCDGP
jgi:hypothetical protein